MCLSSTAREVTFNVLLGWGVLKNEDKFQAQEERGTHFKPQEGHRQSGEMQRKLLGPSPSNILPALL